MKFLMSLFLVLSFANISLAQDTTVVSDAADLPLSLEITMKSMSRNLKKLAAQVADPALNADSAAVAQNLAVLINHSKNFRPKFIDTLPADQQEAMLQKYMQKIDETAVLAQQLAEAFKANDNATATQIIQSLLAAKKDGHNQFDP